MINTDVVLWDSPLIKIERNREEQPLFKREKPDTFRLDGEMRQLIVRESLSGYAQFLGKRVDREIEADPKITATIFAIIGKEVGVSAKDVRHKIKEFVSANREQVIANIRSLAKKSGLSLGDITADEFIRLVGSRHPENLGKKGLSKYLGKKKALTPKHLANHAIIQVAAEIFKVNIILREMYIHYSEGLFVGGIACESMRVKVSREGNTKSIEIIQGFGMFLDGSLFGKFNLKMEHFPPVSFVDAPEKK